MTKRSRLVCVIGGLAITAGIFLLLFALAGCAVGRGTAGEVVLGWDAGRLTETTEQALSGLGDALLPGLGVLLTAVGVPAVGWARASRKAAAEEAASKAHDEAWDEVTGKPPAAFPNGLAGNGGNAGGPAGGVGNG